MKVICAEHLGMCFGVKDAITLALKTAEQRPLTILGDLVHNETVLEDLRSKGIKIEQKAAAVSTETAMVTAHGASDRLLNEARSQGLQIIEATCPLVRVAHRVLKKLVGEGFHPVIIGKRDHVEVRGMTEDLEQFDVVITEAEIKTIEERPRFGIVAQTTQPIVKVRYLAELIQTHFPKSETRFIDTVCQPTKLRQNSAIQLAQKSDVMIVVGGAASNNTRELVQTCAQFCTRVHHVQSAQDLCGSWFQATDTVGITAGTSTPAAAIEAVYQTLSTEGGTTSNNLKYK